MPGPASRPASLSSTHRLRLLSDHLLVARLGVNLRANRWSSRRLIRLSIHPKHNASRTASSYGMDFTAVCFLSNASQTPGLEAWCFASQVRHCCRLRTRIGVRSIRYGDPRSGGIGSSAERETEAVERADEAAVRQLTERPARLGVRTPRHRAVPGDRAESRAAAAGHEAAHG